MTSSGGAVANIHTASGNYIGQLSALGYSNFGTEISLVRLPGSTTNFILTYFLSNSASSRLHYSIIKANTNLVSIVSNSISFGTSSAKSGGIAISRAANFTGNRFLYAVAGEKIRRYVISNTGMGPEIIMYDNTIMAAYVPDDFVTLELELSHDGSKLAWGAYPATKSSDIFIADICGTSITNLQDYDITGNFSSLNFGCEFTASGDSLYFSHEHDPVNGIHILDLTCGGIRTWINNSYIFQNSFIELGNDGKMYVLKPLLSD